MGGVPLVSIAGGEQGVIYSGGEGDVVATFMVARDKKGKSKNYVLLYSDGEVMNHEGRIFEAKDEKTGNVVIPDLPEDTGVILVHKRNLHLYIGDAARKFWKGGRVVG